MESHEKDLRSVVESDEQVQAIQSNYQTAGLANRELAILDYSVKLSKDIGAVGRQDVERLRAAGLNDEEIVDTVHCIAYFNFINRVLDALGVDSEPSMRYGQSGQLQ